MKIYMVPAGDDGVNVRLDRGDGKVYSFKGYVVDSELKRDYDDYGDFREPMLRTPRTTYTLEIDVHDLRMTDVSAAEQMAELFSSFPQRYVLGVDQTPPPAFVEEVPAVVEEAPADVPADWIDLSGA